MVTSAACLSEDTVSRFTEGRLSDAMAADVNEHMAACPECRRLVADVSRSLFEQQTEAVSAVSEPSLVGELTTPLGRQPAPQSAVSPDRNDIIARYVVQEQIGAGGAGVVYRARDPQLSRDVAIKLLRDPRMQAGHRSERRLLREAQAMAQLSHPNVVTVYDAGTWGGQVFVAMELVVGTTLKKWLSEPRSADEVLDAFVAAGRGLAAAHAAGLIHRDFKPDNVLVGSDGRVRVTDFGLACPAASGADDASEAEPRVPPQMSDLYRVTATETGAAVGTPAYMSPEQFLGRRTDERTDQFSFCVALYESLCHQRPFAARKLPELIRQVVGGEVRPMPKAAGVPAAVEAVVMRGLSVDPALRHPSIDALLKALTDARGTSRPPRAPRRGWVIGASSATLLAIAGAGWAVTRTAEVGRLERVLGSTTSTAARAALAVETAAPTRARTASKQRSRRPGAAKPAPASAPASSAVPRHADGLIMDPWVRK